MELKNALAICLISLFSATLVMLIAQSLDSKAAARLEPQLARIVEELEAIRASGPIVAVAPGAPGQPLDDGLIVYYFYGNVRCPTCRAIESQSYEVVQEGFAAELAAKKVAWKMLNYEESAVKELVAKFAIINPVVVLAKMKDGQIDQWDRLDEVWGLVDDKTAFAEFVGTEIQGMLEPSEDVSSSYDTSDIPLPEDDVAIPEESQDAFTPDEDAPINKGAIK